MPLYIENVSLVFFDNDTAGIAGNVLFGGQLEGCEYASTVGSLNCGRNIRNIETSTVKDLFFSISTITPKTLSDISSKVEKIKVCDTDCSNHYSIPVYPGKSFTVTIIPLGQASNPAPVNIINSVQAK